MLFGLFFCPETGKESGMATKTIEEYKKDYAAAKAAGDAAGMKAANDGANAVRAASGQAADDGKPIIRICDLHKSYDDLVVLRGVDL